MLNLSFINQDLQRKDLWTRQYAVEIKQPDLDSFGDVINKLARAYFFKPSTPATSRPVPLKVAVADHVFS